MSLDATSQNILPTRHTWLQLETADSVLGFN